MRRALWDETARLRETRLPVRWVTSEGMHLTLKFLGEVGDELAEGVATALDRVADPVRPFEVAVRGFGAFPNARRPRVVWAGIEPVPALELLQDGVERAMTELGFEPEGRVFRPHLTLGRARHGARPSQFRDLAALLEEMDFAQSFLAEGVHLVQSTLRPSGAVYTVRRTASLGGAQA